MLRTLRRSPGFAVAAIAPIALGIGINTGVFSILNNVMYRPLPASSPNELLSIYQDFHGVQKRRVHGARSMFSLPEYRAYREATQTLSGVTAYTKSWAVTLGGQSPQEIEGVLVACNYFAVLQLRPVIGTGFTAANCDVPNAPPTVVLSHALWTHAFAADAEIVRKTVTLNGQDVAVVGVAPQGFDGTELTRAAFFASLSLQPTFSPERNVLEDPQVSWLTLLARRHKDTAIDQVRAELAVVASQIDRQQPGRTTALLVAPATALSLPVARRDFVGVAAIVLLAFGLILLIACANVANVLLARGAARSREIAVRLAVGARRGRLVQLLLTESAMIALAGGVAGSPLAWWSFQALLPSLLSSVPGISQPRLDAHPNLTVLWFGLALTVTTAMACGVVPALKASEAGTARGHEAGRRQGTDRAGGWLRGALISMQVAVCMVLLISAGLLLRALHAAYTIDPGFEYRNVAVVSVDLRGPQYDDATVVAFRRQATERLGSLPGVAAVAQVSKVPLSSGRSQDTFRLPHQEQTYEVRRERRVTGVLFVDWNPDRQRPHVHARRARSRLTRCDHYRSDGPALVARPRSRRRVPSLRQRIPRRRWKSWASRGMHTCRRLPEPNRRTSICRRRHPLSGGWLCSWRAGLTSQRSRRASAPRCERSTSGCSHTCSRSKRIWTSGGGVRARLRSFPDR